MSSYSHLLYQYENVHETRRQAAAIEHIELRSGRYDINACSSMNVDFVKSKIFSMSTKYPYKLQTALDETKSKV